MVDANVDNVFGPDSQLGKRSTAGNTSKDFGTQKHHVVFLVKVEVIKEVRRKWRVQMREEREAQVAKDLETRARDLETRERDLKLREQHCPEETQARVRRMPTPTDPPSTTTARTSTPPGRQHVTCNM